MQPENVGPRCSYNSAHTADTDVAHGVVVGDVREQVLTHLLDELSLLYTQGTRERQVRGLPVLGLTEKPPLPWGLDREPVGL